MTAGSYNAKVRARGLDGTGVTEDVARALFSAVGSGNARIAIVELEPVRQINEATGDHKVECTLGFVEVAEPGSAAEGILQEFSRALYRDRRAAAGELPGTEGAGERSTDEVIEAAGSALERDEEGGVTGTWNGDTDDGGDASDGATGPGSFAGEAPDGKVGDPDFDPTPEEPAVGPGPGADDESFETPLAEQSHLFLPGTTDATKCAVFACGKGPRAKVHTVVKRPDDSPVEPDGD